MRPSRWNLKQPLIAVLILSLLFFLFFRHRQIEERGSFRWLEKPIVYVTAPLMSSLLFVRDYGKRVFYRYFFLVGVEKENERLRGENERQKIQALFLEELERENERLRHLTDLQKQLPMESIPARVIAYPLITPYRMITINKGAKEGVRRRAAVIAPDGLVGQIARVEGDYSQVLLITDPTHAVDGRIEPSGARGLVVGKVMKLGLKRELFLSAFEYLNQAIEVQEGASVMTSGMDGLYPPGIRIGLIRTKQQKKYDIFQQAEIIPAVDFYKLREVVVLK